MEERASIAPGLPRERPTSSYWQTPLADIANLRTSKSIPNLADVVIIGSGISGACVAYNLLNEQPNLNIVMLEARQAVSGATGRNGGHTKHASYGTFAGNVKDHGQEEALKIAQLEYNCMEAIHDFVHQHSLDCDARRIETVDVYYDEDRLRHAKEGVELMQRLIGTGSPLTQYQFYNPQDTATQFLTPDSFGSVKYLAGSLSAYKLAIGILRLALDKSLNLQTNTTATDIAKSSADNGTTSWSVQTSRGTIHTTKLLLATNGYTAHLYPALQGIIMPLRGEVTAQRPGQSMPSQGLSTSYSLWYAKGFEYAITRPEGTEHAGDIIIGGGLTKGHGEDGLFEYGNSDDTTFDTQIGTYLENCTVDYFKENWGEDHPEGRVRSLWSGIMGYSADGHPFVGPVPGEKGLFLDASFQGHGMVSCFLCADAVTKMMLDQDDPELDAWFPRCFRVTKERMEKKIGPNYRA